jgi:hypothetical protein
MDLDHTFAHDSSDYLNYIPESTLKDLTTDRDLRLQHR